MVKEGCWCWAFVFCGWLPFFCRRSMISDRGVCAFFGWIGIFFSEPNEISGIGSILLPVNVLYIWSSWFEIFSLKYTPRSVSPLGGFFGPPAEARRSDSYVGSKFLTLLTFATIARQSSFSCTAQSLEDWIS